MSKASAHLELGRAELEKALKLLAKTTAKRKGEEAVLSFDGDCLHIEIGGGSVTVPARGWCDRQIRLSGRPLLNLPKVMPAGDPIIFEVKDDNLWIQRFAVKCTVQDAWSKTIDLPVNVTGREAAEVLAGEDAEDVIASGLRKLAISRTSDIERAAALLARYGLDENDIRRLIEWKQKGTENDLFDGE
jgi:hypothetical protein